MPKGTREIKRRIRSVKNTQQITRAMKMVASAKLQRSQNKTRSAQPYARALIRITEHLAKAVPEVEHPFLVIPPPEVAKKVLLIVFTSDKSLCGAFNANIVRRAETFRLNNPELDISLYTIGRYGYRYFSRRKWKIFESQNSYDFSTKFIQLYPLFEKVENAFKEQVFGAIYALYAYFINPMKQIPTIVKLLPVEKSLFEPEGEEGVRSAEDDVDEAVTEEFIFEPSPREVLESLLPRYVRYTLFQAMRENFTSENAARMVAMDNASKNALEMIERLTLQYNKARQQSITLELLDIVGGAEVLTRG